jgi:hypothetical protein
MSWMRYLWMPFKSPGAFLQVSSAPPVTVLRPKTILKLHPSGPLVEHIASY